MQPSDQFNSEFDSTLVKRRMRTARHSDLSIKRMPTNFFHPRHGNSDLSDRCLKMLLKYFSRKGRFYKMDKDHVENVSQLQRSLETISPNPSQPNLANADDNDNMNGQQQIQQMQICDFGDRTLLDALESGVVNVFPKNTINDSLW